MSENTTNELDIEDRRVAVAAQDADDLEAIDADDVTGGCCGPMGQQLKKATAFHVSGGVLPADSPQ